ncbi:MAG: hypothetical protein WAN36_05835, partial [Calditrichia bacterium]
MPKLLDYLSEKYPVEDIKTINKRMVELSSLFEISQILNASIEIKNVLNNILLIPMGRLMISRGMIFLKEKKFFQPRLGKGIAEMGNVQPLPCASLSAEFESFFLPQNTEKCPQAIKEIMHQQKFSAVIPLKSQEKTIGIAFYGPKLNQQPFSTEEIDFLISLANLSATAVENALKVDEIKDINRQLDERIQQLKTLFDIAQGLSATLESDKILKLLTYALMGQMLVYHYAVVIINDRSLQKVECKGFLEESVENIAAQTKQWHKIESALFVADFPA